MRVHMLTLASNTGWRPLPVVVLTERLGMRIGLTGYCVEGDSLIAGFFLTGRTTIEKRVSFYISQLTGIRSGSQYDPGVGCHWLAPVVISPPKHIAAPQS